MTDFSISRFRHWPLALSLLLPALALIVLGNDASWDLRNYHLYGPHAWLHGRTAIDVAPAQMQSFHNPLLDLPMEWLSSASVHPKLIGLWLALPAMLSLWCLLLLHERLSSAPPSFAERLWLALLALTGAATWSTLGLSMNDAFVAAGMLGALWLVAGARQDEPPTRRWLAAGLLAGATAGLKLSGAFYCIAFAFAALAAPGTARVRATRLVAISAGTLIGVASTYGWWGWHLWQAHGNPFFPYFNDIFHSPEVAARPWTDERFRPRGLLDTVLAPFHLLERTNRFAEIKLKDPRLLLGLLGFAWLAWSQRGQEAGRRLRILFVGVFVVVATAAWSVQYGIYRYAIVLELLGCLALALALQQLPRWRGVAMVLALLLVSVDTRRPDWGRVPSARAPLPALAAGARLPPDAMVVVAGDVPLGYVALALPDSVPMIGLINNLMQPGDCDGLQLQARQRLAAHAGPVYLVTAGDPLDQQRLHEYYGLEPSGACLAVRATIGEAWLCPQARVAPLRTACAATD